MTDDLISTTPVPRCPACEGRTATTPEPCPACGVRYEVAGSGAYPSIRLEDASFMAEASWWALAVGSASFVCVAVLFADGFAVVLCALAVPALARAFRMALRGPTYPEMDPAPYLGLAFLASCGVLLATAALSAAFTHAVAAVPARPGTVPVLEWVWFATFIALHLLFWPRRKGPRRPPSPDPED